jgi:predicted nucleotidyltransferase
VDSVAVVGVLSVAAARVAAGKYEIERSKGRAMEAKLTDLVNRLKTSAGDNLKAVILYGSAISGEFREGFSDLNVLCLVTSASSTHLEELHSVAEWWTRQGNSAPLIFTLDELHRSADVFSIELLDIKAHHRVLLGEDFLGTFEVPLRLHRIQVERELRSSLIRLRQGIVAAPLSNRDHLGLMTQSISAFCALFRHSVIAMGQPAPTTKREAVSAVASITGADPSAFNTILDVREGKQKKGGVDVEASLHAYLEFVEVVTNEVDRRLDF